MLKKIKYLSLFIVLCLPLSAAANDELTKQAPRSQLSNQYNQDYSLNTALTAPNHKMCKEACWAQSASDRQLKNKYGQTQIPKKFRFADRYYKQGERVYMQCMKPHGPMAVLNKSISGRCSAKANKVCEKACLRALK